MVDIPEQAVQAAIRGYASSKQHTFDGQIHDALTAAAPHMSGVKVKQLVWSDVCEPNGNNRYTHITAYSPIGIWSIEWKAWKDYDDKTIFLDGDFIGNGGDNLEAAKAAAQTDYEKRILSALEPSSAREQALEEAAQIAECHSDDRARRYSMDWNDGYIDGCKGAAAAIRALKSQPAAPSGGGE